MRRFDDRGSGGDSYTTNRHRGQAGQISFITGGGSTEESKTADAFPAAASSSFNGPTSASSSSASQYALAPVQDFERRGRSQSPPRRRDDVVDVDTSYNTAVAPFTRQQQPPLSSKYYQYPPPASSSAAPSSSSSSSSHSVDAMASLVYELRASLSSEQEQRKLLHAQLTELRASTQSHLSDLRSSVLHVAEDIKGGEGRLLQLTGRLKELEVQSTVESRLQERSDRVDERAQQAQHSGLQALVSDLRAQIDEQSARHREDLEAVHREHQRAVAAVKDQAVDARQAMEERMAQQAELFSQRLQVAVERIEGGGPSREEVASLTAKMAALQGECSGMEVSVREMRELSRREGDDASSKGDWVRTLMTEQLQTQGRTIQDKIDSVEEGRRTVHAAQQRELTAVREELDRRLKEASLLQAQAAEREREAREDVEVRVQAALRAATSGLSSLVKETVASLAASSSTPPASPRQSSSSPSSSSLSSTVASLSDAQSELESVLRAEIKTRMKAYNKTKARIDLLQGQLEGVKAMLGEEGGEVKRIREELKEEGRKLERFSQRVKDIKQKAEDGLEKERRAVADVEKRVASVEEVRRRMDGSVDEVRRRVEGVEELRRRLEALEAEAKRDRGTDGLTRRIEALEADGRKAQAIDELKRRLDALEGDGRKLQAIDELRRDVSDIQRGHLPAIDGLSKALDTLKQDRAEHDRALTAQQQTAAKAVQDEMSALRQQLQALERASDDAARELARAQKDDERARRSGTEKDEEVKREVEGLRREVKEKVAQMTSRVLKVEHQEQHEQREVEGVSRAMQQLKDELREVERATKARVEQLQAEVVGLKSAAAAGASVAAAGRTEDGERPDVHEEEEAMMNALEARNVLDDMVHAIDQQQQQQRIDDLRQHLNAQLLKVEHRLEQCESAVAATRTDHSQPRKPSLTAPAPALRQPTPPPAMPPQLTQSAHDLRGAEEVQQLKAVVTGLQQQAHAQHKAESGWREQLRSDALKEAREQGVGVKEALVGLTSRLELLEETGPRKDDYAEEMSRRVLQQLTEVEVRMARMDREMAVLQAEARKSEPSSWPSTARGPSDGEEPDAAAVAAAADASAARQHAATLEVNQHETDALVSQLSGRLNELAIRQAELTEQLSTLAASPSPAASPPMHPTSLSAPPRPSISHHRPSLAPEFAAQMGYLQQAVTSQIGDLAFQVQQQQKTIEGLRQQLALSAEGGNRRGTVSKGRGVGEAAERGTILPANRQSTEADHARADGALQATVAELSARMTAADEEREKWRGGIETAMGNALLEQQHLQRSLELLKDRVHTLHAKPNASTAGAPPSHRHSSTFTDSDSALIASVDSHDRASTGNPAAPSVASVDARSRSVSLEAALASQVSTFDHFQQRVTGEIGELSWRVNELANQLKAPAPTDALAVQPSTGGQSPINAEGAWQSAMDHLHQTTSSQIGELSWRLNEVAGLVDSLKRAHVEAPATAVQPPQRAAAAAHVPAAVPEGVESERPATAVNGEVRELRSDFQHVQQVVSGQVGELSWKVSALQERFESWKEQLTQPLQQRSDAEQPRTSRTEASIPEAPSSTEAGQVEEGGLESRVVHLEHAVIAQIGEISFRFGAQHDAFKAHIGQQMDLLTAAQQHVELVMQRLNHRVQSLPPAAAPALPTQPDAPVAVTAPSDEAAVAELGSQLSALQQLLTTQVGELSFRLNELSATVQQLSSAAPQPPPPTSTLNDTVTVHTLQHVVDAVQSTLEDHLQTAVTQLTTRIDALTPPPHPHVTDPSPSPDPATSALSDRVAATDARLSSLSTHVQQLEDAQMAVRASEEKEMEGIVSRITSIYQHSRDEDAATHSDLVALRTAVDDLRSTVHTRDAQLIALDEAVGEELRAVLDDIVRVEGEGKGERLLLQRRLRELESVLSRLYLRVTGKPLSSPTDSSRSTTEAAEPSPRPSTSSDAGNKRYAPLQSFRGQRDRPKAQGEAQAEERNAGAFSFAFANVDGSAAPPMDSGRVDSERSASAMASLKMDDGDLAEDGLSHSAAALLPMHPGSAHHGHVSIDQAAGDALFDAQHKSASSVDSMYDPLSPPAAPTSQSSVPPPIVNPPASVAALSVDPSSAAAAHASATREGTRPQSPFSPLMSSRSLARKAEQSSPQHRQVASEPPARSTKPSSRTFVQGSAAALPVSEEAKAARAKMVDLANGDGKTTSSPPASTVEGRLSISGTKVGALPTATAGPPAASAAVPPIDWRTGSTGAPSKHRASLSQGGGLLGLKEGKGRTPPRFASTRHSLSHAPYENALQ